MASYTKRGKSWQYEISYKDANGKYKKIRKSGFKTKSDARLEANEIELKLAKGLNVISKDVTLYDHFRLWFTLYKKDIVSDITLKKYENTLVNIDKYFKLQTVKGLSRTSYQLTLNKFAETHTTDTTKRLNSHIRASLRNLVDEGVIPFDFTKGAVIKGNDKEKNEEDKFLNYEEFTRLMALAKKDLNPRFASRLMIYVAGMTGLRFSELLALTWDRIDFDKKLIKVDRSFDYKITHDFIATKNLQSQREIAVSDETIEVLRDFRQRQSALFKRRTITPPYPFIFYNANHGSISNHSVNNKLSVLLKQLDIQTPLTIHGLRHTHASSLIYKGVNLLAISKRLGHKNLTVTMEVYTHAIRELEERENDKIRNFLNDLK